MIGIKLHNTSATRITVDNGFDVISVSVQNRQQPVLFTVDNGFFWSGIAMMLGKVSLDTPRIPANVKFVE